MALTLETSDRDFMAVLRRNEPGTVQALCDSLGVTATAVRQRLLRLQGMGFVDRKTIRSGRGRPYHAYYVTDEGSRHLGENYEELAVVLWQELKEVEDEKVRSYLLTRVQEHLVGRYGKGVDGQSLLDRLEQLREALGARGFDVEVDTSGNLPILRENNCPYHDLAVDDKSICELEQRVFEKVLGADMVLKQRCVDGHNCCEFTAEAASATETGAAR
ncbi:helix-turn-helix transcriptional regulator [Calycomorphotria hydatis]|uniref:MarR family protein n=1 Tax=Calycomorphotria hydatis TaxID=2528027 RepID=A0A517T7Q1_9PLAN|nr:MarR family transcriptional regulator [Calycomorphotria hydatis]QDT64403.1 MarR family protein [Calycomorphotria hydatis]